LDFMLFIYIIFIIAAYFLGAFPYMVLIGKLKGYDLSRERDLHDFLFNKMGKGWGISGFLFDILKGIITVLAGYLLQFPLLVVAIAALSAICGQMWPVFNKFDGEHGNTIGLGVNSTFSIAYGAPLVIIIAICIAVTGLLIRTINRWRQKGDTLKERIKLGGKPSNIFPLAVITAFASCIPTSIIFNMQPVVTWCFAAVLLLLLVRRVTGGLREDLKKSNNTASVIINRLLFDRSEI
jgi:glycerol-3-phosphate acyltransferase PlsY